MAVFENPWAEQGLDWLILQNSPIALYCNRGVLQEDIAWFEGDGYRVISVDCAEWQSERRFHKAIKKALGFPDYYGENLDAFNDCVSDLDVPDQAGLVLTLWDFASFSKRHPSLAHAVLDILASKSRWFLLFGKRLIILVQSADPDIQLEPAGSCSVCWNPKEFLRAKRDSGNAR